MQFLSTWKQSWHQLSWISCAVSNAMDCTGSHNGECNEQQQCAVKSLGGIIGWKLAQWHASKNSWWGGSYDDVWLHLWSYPKFSTSLPKMSIQGFILKWWTTSFRLLVTGSTSRAIRCTNGCKIWCSRLVVVRNTIKNWILWQNFMATTSESTSLKLDWLFLNTYSSLSSCLIRLAWQSTLWLHCHLQNNYLSLLLLHL